MKVAYIKKRFKAESLALIDKCDTILTHYTERGYRMTLRQLYYKLVSSNVVANSVKSYKNVGSLVSDGRLAGYLDWDAIEDRGRQPKPPPEFSSLGNLIHSALHSYRLPRRADQEFYVELWVEKDALAGILAPIAREHHVTLLVNKGYSSQSAMRESALRFIEAQEAGQGGVLLYLGDHDPSGEDMVRDIGDRMTMFGVSHGSSYPKKPGFAVRKVALTMKQIKQYNPPPNPAKITDPRAGKYIELHGEHSWEVDALPPDVLTEIIESEIERFTDQSAIDKVIKQEKLDRFRLDDFLKRMEDDQ